MQYVCTYIPICCKGWEETTFPLSLREEPGTVLTPTSLRAHGTLIHSIPLRISNIVCSQGNRMLLFWKQRQNAMDTFQVKSLESEEDEVCWRGLDLEPSHLPWFTCLKLQGLVLGIRRYLKLPSLSPLLECLDCLESTNPQLDKVILKSLANQRQLSWCHCSTVKHLPKSPETRIPRLVLLTITYICI
jgi:hypothetical protein